MSSGFGAVVTYAVLALLWSAVVLVYARQWPATKGDRALRLLLAFLIAEALRTVVESAYFGLLWGANYGLLPDGLKVLGQPVFLTAAKLMTFVLGIVVLVGVARVWIPTELQRRQQRRDAEQELRRQLEESLRAAREREEQFSLAATASRDGLWDENLRTGERSLSLRFWQVLGYDELPPDTAAKWLSLIHPDDKQRVIDEYRAFLTSGETNYEVRYRIFHRDGSVVHLHGRGMLVKDEHGKPIRLVGFTRDVTEDFEAEAHRVQTQKMEGLGLLAGGIAHDFNNLLTVVSSSLSLAERQSERGVPVHEALQTAGQAVQRATALTRQLLAYAGRTNLSQHPLDLNQVVQGIGELLSVSMPRKVKLVQSLAPDLPGVLGDDGQLQQVVMNLITNAAEAIGDADGTVTLRTEVVTIDDEPADARTETPRGRVVCLTVEDTGCGMTAPQMARIFDPFFTTKGTGRGLGLAAMVGILRKHGGGVGVHSELEKGTRFRVFFPALAVAPAAPQLVAQRAASSKINARVLLVDDEPLLRRSATRLLVMLGCSVSEASTGAEAVKLVTATPDAFDVVLMDLTMPEMDGFEATQRIAKVAPNLAVVVSSGYTAVELPPQLPPSTRALAKPYDVNRLEAILREVTSAHAG